MKHRASVTNIAWKETVEYLAIICSACGILAVYALASAANLGNSIGNYSPTERAVKPRSFNPRVNQSSAASMGSLLASLHGADLKHIGYNTIAGNSQDKLRILLRRWCYLIIALAGWFVLGWGWWNMRYISQLHWSMWVFLFGTVLWASGFTLLVTSF